jgi:hypothetical protein
MAIGDPQDDDGAYHGGVKQGLLGLQLPRSSRANGFYGTQLPLAPGIQQVQYMYPRQDARHEQYSAVRVSSRHQFQYACIPHSRSQQS